MPILVNVADLIMGQSPPSNTYNEVGEGLPFYQGKADFGYKHPIPRLYCSSPMKIAEPGDILISVRAPVGPTNIANNKMCIGRGLAAIRAKAIDSNFLYFNLKYLEPLIVSYGTGSTFKAINKSHLSNIVVNPYEIDISDQQKIAKILTTVEISIEQQTRLITLMRELKSALMHKLFTEGLRGEKQKETEIGQIPESWEIIKLGDLVNITTGKLDSNAATPFGRYPFFTCSPETLRIDSFAFDTEAILLAGNNARGIYSVKHFKGKFNAYQRTYVLTQKNEKLLPYNYFLYALTINLEHLRSLSIGTSTKYLTLGILKNLLILKPKFDEASEIGNTLFLIDKKINKTTEKKQLLEELFRTLLNQLMTGQIRIDNKNLPDLEIEEIN